MGSGCGSLALSENCSEESKLDLNVTKHLKLQSLDPFCQTEMLEQLAASPRGPCRFWVVHAQACCLAARVAAAPPCSEHSVCIYIYIYIIEHVI